MQDFFACNPLPPLGGRGRYMLEQSIKRLSENKKNKDSNKNNQNSKRNSKFIKPSTGIDLDMMTTLTHKENKQDSFAKQISKCWSSLSSNVIRCSRNLHKNNASIFWFSKIPF